MDEQVSVSQSRPSSCPPFPPSFIHNQISPIRMSHQTKLSSPHCSCSCHRHCHQLSSSGSHCTCAAAELRCWHRTMSPIFSFAVSSSFPVPFLFTKHYHFLTTRFRRPSLPFDSSLLTDMISLFTDFEYRGLDSVGKSSLPAAQLVVDIRARFFHWNIWQRQIGKAASSPIHSRLGMRSVDLGSSSISIACRTVSSVSYPSSHFSFVTPS